jgi:hypothetical protein
MSEQWFDASTAHADIGHTALSTKETLDETCQDTEEVLQKKVENISKK